MTGKNEVVLQKSLRELDIIQGNHDEEDYRETQSCFLLKPEPGSQNSAPPCAGLVR